MAKTTDKVKAVVKALAVKSVQFACGTASTNHFCQTKEPRKAVRVVKMGLGLESI